MKPCIAFLPASHLVRQTVALCLLVLVWVPRQIHAQGYKLLNTFTNPTPANADYFGEAMAPLGNDRVLIGTSSDEQNTAGKAYLFGANGTLLTTFTNPYPRGDGFGISIAAVGSDRVLIGALLTPLAPTPGRGSAYLFATNGALLTTFTNPNPTTSTLFGSVLAGFGNDRLLIDAQPVYNGSGHYLSAVYLFRTNGTLLTTFTNPVPTGDNYFGTLGLAGLGNNRVLISAAGENKVYLYDTNATLMMTFPDPDPGQAGLFGYALASLGSDRVLISKTGQLVSGPGVVYLFSTNGTLLTTFTNGATTGYDGFGKALAVVGTDRVIIGAEEKNVDSVDRAGAAYLFSTNGTLLNIFTNSTPTLDAFFGFSVGATGNGQVFVGEPTYYTATPVGTAYLFSTPGPIPPLTITRNGSGISISWITSETGLVLQQAGSLGIPAGWSDTTNSVSVTGQTNTAQQTIGPGSRFFRLQRP